MMSGVCSIVRWLAVASLACGIPCVAATSPQRELLDKYCVGCHNDKLKAAGLEHRPPYALRHSYASFAIAVSSGLFELSRLMGTSVEMIDER